MRKSTTAWLVSALEGADKDLAESIRKSFDVENFFDRADSYAAELAAADRSRESLIQELAGVRARLDGYRCWAWAMHDTLTVVWPAARLGRDQILATAKAVEARKRAVTGRVDAGYGEAVARIGAELRSRSPGCSLAAIVREVRARKAAGSIPDAKLPANDRTIEVQLRRMGF